jgi:hypothetical protein
MGKSLHGQLLTKMQKWQNAKSKKTTSYEVVSVTDSPTKTFLFGELCFVWAFSLNQLGEITLVKVRDRTTYENFFAPAPVCAGRWRTFTFRFAKAS